MFTVVSKKLEEKQLKTMNETVGTRWDQTVWT